jgi:hypothetical protein
MAEQSGSVGGPRAPVTTPVRVGSGEAGSPQLITGRLYPAAVLRGGSNAVLRLLGNNIGARTPPDMSLTPGDKLLVRPEVQGGRVSLEMVRHGDLTDRVAQRFQRLVQRNPWPLPPPSSGTGATGQPPGLGEASAPQRLAPDRGSVRAWLEQLLGSLREAPAREDPAQTMRDSLLAEKGRMLLERWGFIPLPLSGEHGGAWLEMGEGGGQGAEGDEEGTPPMLRMWLNSNNLGGMELILPVQAGGTWRIRCERPETAQRMEAARPRLEWICMWAGQSVAIRVEGPDPRAGEPPESLRRAAGVAQGFSTRI